MTKHFSHFISIVLLTISVAVINYSLSYPPPVTAGCISGLKQCCNNLTGYQICMPSGLWGECYYCSYGCYSGSCKSAPAPTATPQPVCDPDSWRCCTITTVSDGHQQCRSDGSGWGGCSLCSYKCDISRPQYCLPTPTPTPKPTATPIPPTPTPVKICTPYEWQCCNLGTGHQQCSSTGTYWSGCYTCGYNCNLVTGACIVPTPTPTPKPTATPVPFCQTGETQCCNNSQGSQFCVNNSYWSTCTTCPYGCNFLTSSCYSSPPPTFTPVPPTPTPTPVCKPLNTLCTGNTQCCSGQCAISDTSTSYYCDTSCGGSGEPCCYSGSCDSGLTCILGKYCVVPPSPTPTPIPKICSSLSYLCTDPISSSYSAKIDRCNDDQTEWVFAYYCQPDQVCNSTRNACTASITSTTTSVCTEGSTMCSGIFKLVCYHGSWELTTDNSSCTTPDPTGTSTYDCQLVNDIPYCTQTNPLWASNPFPAGCSDPQKVNKLSAAACGPATTCSLLCACKKTPEYCNLQSCLENVPLYSFISCEGTGISVHQQVLSNFPECLHVSQVIPDTFVDPSTQINLSTPLVSWEKVDQLLAAGNVVQIGGLFTPIAGGDPVAHISLIVGKDFITGKRIYNDPYFNMENDNPLYQVPTKYLEDYIKIKIDSANAIILK